MNRFLGIVGFTVIEAATLAGWLELTTINQILAIVVLFAGLIGEHFVSFRVKNPGVDFRRGNLVLISAVEAVTWAGWLALTVPNPVLAIIVLSVGLLFGHVLELNNISLVPITQKFFRRLGLVIDITLIEVAAAEILLAFFLADDFARGIAFLFGLLLVEHTISFRKKVQ